MPTPRTPGTVRKRHRPAAGEPYTLRRPRTTQPSGSKLNWRVIDRETGRVAKTYKGEPLDDGGYGTEQQAQRELARLNKRPIATWLGERRETASPSQNGTEPGAPTIPSSPSNARHKICDFVLCRAPAVLRCEGVNQVGDYCPIHAETRGFRIPERPRPEKPETR